MKCIDLYAGIGGWTLGMKLSGIEHVASYEWNEESNRTHNHNFGTVNTKVDIRKLPFSELPEPGSIDIVVGSPPCTQFSFSNKGGKGDINDGLIDIYKFLEIVRYLKPKYWAMENVPRVKKIIDDLVASHPDFKKFAPLISFNDVINCWEFGVPQKRKRMICGNFPHELFLSYRNHAPRVSMGDALQQLRPRVRTDRLYGWARGKIFDNDEEELLAEEEVRINREAKCYHPVYNKMPFPDPMDQPARTVTSLCTRISRESIVIQKTQGFRRLTIRERAVLMGFPVNYQFYADSYGAKLKMIGNAIPPPLTYHLFNSMRGIGYLPLETQQNYRHHLPGQPPTLFLPPTPRRVYKSDRSFRFCVPGLRYGSGVRFELSNLERQWRVRLFYGSSKNIKELPLDDALIKDIQLLFPLAQRETIRSAFRHLDSTSLQQSWTGGQGIHPFDVIDELGRYAEALTNAAIDCPKERDLAGILGSEANRSLLGSPIRTLAGIFLGSSFNTVIRENEAARRSRAA